MALAATSAAHDVVCVLTRGDGSRFGPRFDWGDSLPTADLGLIAVSDGAIEEVAGRVAEREPAWAVVAHLSGFVPVTALNELAALGISTGGFHPLQTLPDADRGAKALAGAYVGIGGDRLALDTLTHFANSLSMTPFRLEDDDRPAYHAAAAAAANFVISALGTSHDLFESAGVDPKVSRPLVERAIANAYSDGPGESLTGPIARGDLETVVGHLTAAHLVSDEVGRQFRLMAEATAIRAGRDEEVAWWS